MIGLNPNSIHVLHPWVDVSKFIPPDHRPTQEKFHILSVGRLVEKKGHVYSISAVSEIIKKGFDVEYYIAGDGPLKEELESLSSQMVGIYFLMKSTH